jgi:hypothetical protein
MTRTKEWGFFAAITASALAILMLVAVSFAFRVYLERRRASQMMTQLAQLQVGTTEQSEALKLMRQFENESRDSKDCLGGPCLGGKIYQLRRKGLPFSNLWPETDLEAGLYFSHGVLVIKHLKFSQEYPRYSPGLDIIEDEYPFPERHWDVEIPNGFLETSQGTELLFSIDRRAPSSKAAQTFSLNLSCFSHPRGCPCAGKLKSESVQCGKWPPED